MLAQLSMSSRGGGVDRAYTVERVQTSSLRSRGVASGNVSAPLSTRLSPGFCAR